MKILVLGGTRFFGAHLVKSLIEEGHDIIIATRGNHDFSFKDKIHFIKTDRNNLEDLKELSAHGPFDLIYDQICMSAKNAHDACVAFKGQCKRFIFTSTGSVYNPIAGVELTEKMYDQEHYLINLEDTIPYNYQEGKRQAEAVYSKMAPFPVAIVRFPIVIGLDDFKKRMEFHIDAVKKGEEIYFPNLMSQLSFIQSHEAGKFLNFIGKHTFTGAVNASSTGYISLFDLMAMIEKHAGKRALFAEAENETNHSPFGFEVDFMMPNTKASSLGFQFEKLDDYLAALINRSK